MKKFFPFLIIFAMLVLLGKELLYANPNKFSFSLIGEPISNFRLPTVFSSQKFFSKKDLLGRVSLLNIWATWCYACKAEMTTLMEIKKQYSIPIYGIVYKDEPEEIRQWLKQYGNPYRLIGDDRNGEVAIDLGIYGTPETFVIDPRGNIIYKHVGTLDKKTWETVILPLVKRYE